MKAPVTIYVVHHPQCKEAEKLASRLFQWFRLGYLSGDASAAGLPIYFRRQLAGSTPARFGDLLPRGRAGASWEAGLLRRAVIDRYREEHRRGARDRSYELFGIMIFDLWYGRHFG